MNLKLEKLKAVDFSDYFSLVGNLEVMQMITERALDEAEAQKDFQELLENNQLLPIFGSYKILHADTQAFIGFAKIRIESVDAKEAELGYMLLPQYWGLGITGQIGKALVELARCHEGLQRLHAIIDPANKASRKILINNKFSSKGKQDYEGLPAEYFELKLK